MGSIPIGGIFFIKLFQGYTIIRSSLKQISQLAGFEPTRAEPIGFQVQRLDHSATTAPTLEMWGIEPQAFHMQSERSTTELHPLFDSHVNSVKPLPLLHNSGVTKIVEVPTGGLEPPIFGLGDRRLIH